MSKRGIALLEMEQLNPGVDLSHLTANQVTACVRCLSADCLCQRPPGLPRCAAGGNERYFLCITTWRRWHLSACVIRTVSYPMDLADIRKQGIVLVITRA